jgi:hypothetical protein
MDCHYYRGLLLSFNRSALAPQKNFARPPTGSTPIGTHFLVRNANTKGARGKMCAGGDNGDSFRRRWQRNAAARRIWANQNGVRNDVSKVLLFSSSPFLVV